MISEGNTGKYLKYALGEIVLVVIGILIALQINNWNEQRKTDIKEQILLRSLRQEFIHNREELNTVIEITRNNIKGAGEFASILSPEETNLSDAEIATYWNNALRREAIYRPGLGVLNEAINSGNLSVIKNSELRNILFSFDAELQQLRKQEEVVFDVRMKCYDILSNYGSFRKLLDNIMDTASWYSNPSSAFENSNTSILQSEKFENDLVFFIAASKYFENNFLIPLEQRIGDCIKILDAEIKD